MYQIYLENDILNRIDHPNIIKMYGVFEDSDKLYMVLEYIENGDFYDFLKKNGN